MTQDELAVFLVAGSWRPGLWSFIHQSRTSGSLKKITGAFPSSDPRRQALGVSAGVSNSGSTKTSTATPEAAPCGDALGRRADEWAFGQQLTDVSACTPTTCESKLTTSSMKSGDNLLRRWWFFGAAGIYSQMPRRLTLWMVSRDSQWREKSCLLNTRLRLLRNDAVAYAAQNWR